MPDDRGIVVKFPTGRIVRTRLRPSGPNAEIQELDRALCSIDHAIAALQRQRHAVVLRYLHAAVRHERQGRPKARKRRS